MNPGGKGSWPLHLGSTQPCDLTVFVMSVARWWEYLRWGALGPGLPVEPFILWLPAPCLLWGCHYDGPGESFWLLDLGCSAPFLSAVSWSRPHEGLWCPAALQSAWSLGIGVWEGSSDRLQTAAGVVEFT